MSRFISEYLGTIAIGVLLTAGVGAIIASMIRSKRKGGSASCGCGCANCSHGENCGAQPSSLAGNDVSAVGRERTK
ncbi:MAG: FeoB-associated Cys-rich membrane protein [Oscillospiraceae bacterium]|nr:FeoB-associated Cys-rich membrane protein [Oscillospiraceae bacterium]